jgi:plastocyanin
MRVPRTAAIAAALILSLGLAACSKGTSTSTTAGTTTTVAGGSPTTTASTPAATAGAITIHNFMFQPNPSHATVGETITVTNSDGTDHSLTADNGSFDTGVFSSGSKTIVITKPGTYTFHCRIHNFMKGTIIVTS